MCSFPSPVQPTLTGYIASTKDANLAVQACLAGHLLLVPRRPNNLERTLSIKSGSVFIYEERMSGIKRWTDGLTWSPSRVLGDFLIYRELKDPLSPCGNARKLHTRGRVKKLGDNKRSRTTHRRSDQIASTQDQNELQRSLVGSLIDSYPFKAGGLIKKATTIFVFGGPYHLVSYYTMDDTTHQRLSTPGDIFGLEGLGYRLESNLQGSTMTPMFCNNTEEIQEDRWNARHLGLEGGVLIPSSVPDTEPNWTIENDQLAIADHEDQEQMTVINGLALEPGNMVCAWWPMFHIYHAALR